MLLRACLRHAVFATLSLVVFYNIFIYRLFYVIFALPIFETKTETYIIYAIFMSLRRRRGAAIMRYRIWLMPLLIFSFFES